jgi:hypothetical protein
MEYVAVVLIGGLVGAAELIARYRDAPLIALRAWSAAIYVSLNAAASGVALGLIQTFDWEFGQTGDAARWTQVLVAGFGAMALFRSSLFFVRVGGQDVGVGPSGFLQIMLNAADRDVDRRRANARAALVGEIMADVSFDRAVVALPTYCLALMQNVPYDVQDDLTSDLRELADTEMDERVKSLNLGLRIVNITGPRLLAVAVTSLGPTIRRVDADSDRDGAEDAPTGPP